MTDHLHPTDWPPNPDLRGADWRPSHDDWGEDDEPLEPDTLGNDRIDEDEEETR